MRIILALFLILFSPSSFSMTPDQIRSEIHDQMSQRHPSPSDEFWSKLGPEALSVIQQMYKETDSTFEKTWLIDGMAHFSDPSVGGILEDGISKSENLVMKKKMLSALVQSQGDEALGFVEPYLKDQDPHIRLAVALAIKAYASQDQSAKVLGGFLQNEKEAWVKKDLESSVQSGSLMKRSRSVFIPKEEVPKLAQPLLEKDWVGEWKGVYLTPDRTSAANALLSFPNKKWKVEIKLPKKTKFEMNGSDLEVSYFQTASQHWIQVKSKKNDAVFIAQKKAKP